MFKPIGALGQCQPQLVVRPHNSFGGAKLGSAAISPDGQYIVVGGKDGSVRVYPTAAKHYLRLASGMLRGQAEYAQVQELSAGYAD